MITKRFQSPVPHVNKDDDDDGGGKLSCWRGGGGGAALVKVHLHLVLRTLVLSLLTPS